MGSNKRPERDGGTIQVPRHKRVIENGDRISRRVRAAAGNGDGSGSVRGASRSVCRIFGLVHRTVRAKQAAVGMPLWGEFDADTVRIHSNQVGELGDAPSQEARFFISERNERGSGALTGAVIKTTAHDVGVKLCIN